MTTHLIVALMTCLLVYSPMATANVGNAPADQQAPTPSQDVAARIAELEAQLNLLKAQQSVLLYATTQRTEAANTEKALVEAQTSLLKSQIDQMKVLIPSTQAGLAGSWSGDLSTARGSVQAWIDLDKAFSNVASRVNKQLGDNCTVVLNPPSLDEYIAGKWITESLGIVAAQLPHRIDTLKGSTPPELLVGPPPPTKAFGPEVIPALVGPIIDSVIGFTKLFRSDRTFSGVAITPGTDSIYNVAASRLVEAKCKVIDVEHLTVPDATFPEQFKKSDLNRHLAAVLTQLDEIDKTYYHVATNTKNFEADPRTPKSTAAFYEAAVARWKELSDKLHQAIDPMISVPSTVADSMFLKLLKGIMIDNLLARENFHLIFIKVEALGGNRLIKKNVWTPDRAYESASYIVSYRVVDKTGKVVLAGMVSQNGDFKPMLAP